MKRFNLLCLLFLFIALCLTTAAQQPAPQAQPQTPPAKLQTPAPQPQTPAAPTAKPATADAGSDLVVARVGGEPITEKGLFAKTFTYDWFRSFIQRAFLETYSSIIDDDEMEDWVKGFNSIFKFTYQ